MAYTTVYTPNVAYSASEGSWRFRAYVEYQTTSSLSSVKVEVRYGVALSSGYSSTTHDYDPHYVCVIAKTGSSTTKNTGYVVDNTDIGGSSYSGVTWHQTGSFDFTVSRTISSQTVTLTVYGATSSTGSQNQSASASITIDPLSSYSISYTLNGGSLPSGTNSKRTYNSGYEAVNPTSAYWDRYPNISGVTFGPWFYVETPTRTGYNFAGWTVTGMDSNSHHYWYNSANQSSTATSWANTSSAAYAHEFYNLRGSSGTVTFTANWTASITMSVTYDLNGGTITDAPHNKGSNWFSFDEDGIVTRATSQTGTYSTLVNSLGIDTTYDMWNVTTYNGTRQGYHVVATEEYNTQPDGSGVKINQESSTTNPCTTKRINGGTEIATNTAVTLYVDWRPNTYTITYNSNGGNGTTPISHHTYGESEQVSVNNFTKTGYTFIGWNRDQTAADQGIVEYGPDFIVGPTFCSIDGYNFTFYAVWNKYVPVWGRTDNNWQMMNKLWVLKDGQWREIISAWVLKEGIWRSAFGSGSSVNQ